MKVIRLAATALGGLLLMSSPAVAKNVIVPRDFPTIQAAVDAAAAGDTVTVGRGTFGPTERELVTVLADLERAKDAELHFVSRSRPGDPLTNPDHPLPRQRCERTVSSV